MLAIAIPAYNRPECLRMALKSLEYQTFKRFFTIVVDDCSTEDIKSICDDSHLNLTYLHQAKNQGPAAARQKALDLCYKNNIDLIMFLDSDDMLMPHAVERLHYEITHTNSDMVSSTLYYQRLNEPYTVIEYPQSLTWTHGKIYRVKSLIENDISFNTDLKTNEDLEFNLKVDLSPIKKLFIDEVTYLMKYEPNSICRIKDDISARVSGIDYFKAIYYAATWALKHNYEISDMSLNIMNFYDYYQKMLVLEKDTTEVDKIIKILYNYDKVKEFFKYKKYWRQYQPKQFFYNEGKIKFYPQTLKEWLNNFGIEVN